MAREQRLAKRRSHWRDVQELAEEAKGVDRLVARARAMVTHLSETDDRAWDLAAAAAALETLLQNAEAEAHLATTGHSLW